MIRLIRAETRRLLSTRLWIWGLLLAVVAGGALTGMGAVLGPENFSPPMPGLDTAEGVRNILGLIGFTVIVPALLGTVAVTGEYRHATIAATFLFAPKRWRVLTAKLGTYILAGCGYGLVAAASAAASLYAGAAVTGTTIGLPVTTVAALLLRLAAAMAVYMVLGVAVGALLRNQIAAIAVIVGYLQMGEVMLLLIPGVSHAYPFLPGGATAALTDFSYLSEAVAAQTSGTAGQLLSAPMGALVLGGYVLVGAMVAIVLPLRRDVT